MPTRSPATVHIVVPCFYESARIIAFLPTLAQQLDALGGCTLLLVDDGSSRVEQAQLRAIVEALRPHAPCLQPLLALPTNLGKGGAVYAGWQQHGGAEVLAFIDADGSCSATELVRLIQKARSTELPLVALFASRVEMLGHSIMRSPLRHLVGRIYAALVAVLLGVRVHDSQCGLKLVPRRAYEVIEPYLVVQRFAFDVELLCALLDSGCSVIEVPIDWHEVADGKVRLVRDSWRMWRDILAIRRTRRANPLPHMQDSEDRTFELTEVPL